MTHRISYYVDPEPAIAALSEKYGQQFEQLNTADKLLIIEVLTNSLRIYVMTSTPISIDSAISENAQWQAHMDHSLLESLISLDACPPKTLLSLLEAMIAQLRYSQYQSFE